MRLPIFLLSRAVLLSLVACGVAHTPSPVPTLPSGERPEDIIAAARETMAQVTSFTMHGTIEIDEGERDRLQTVSLLVEWARHEDEAYDESYYRIDTGSQLQEYATIG